MSDLRKALDDLAGPQHGVSTEDVRARISARSRHRTLALASLATFVLLVGAIVVLAADGGDTDRAPLVAAGTPTTVPEDAARWEQLPPSPLSPRTSAHAFTLGNDIVVFGGRDAGLCPPGFDCSLAGSPTLTDGAAFNLDSSEWRSIADLPSPIESADGVVVRDRLYVLGRTQAGAPTLLEFDPAPNRWRVLPAPPDPGGLVGAGDVLLSYSASSGGDSIFDPSVPEWRALPPSPLEPSSERSMTWSGEEVVLTAAPLEPAGGSAQPLLLQAASLNLSTRQWRRLPDSEIFAGGDRWFEVDGLVINPDPESTDGGHVEDWGRSYPYGGILDPSSSNWSTLPTPPSDVGGLTESPAAGDTVVLNSRGHLLDLRSREWLVMPAISEGPELGQAVTFNGDAIISWGGVSWSGPSPQLFDDGWIWRSELVDEPSDQFQSLWLGDCPGARSAVRDEAPDVLPREGATERDRVATVMEADGATIAKTYEAIDIRVESRDGAVWSRNRVGDVRVHLVDDYHLVVVLASLEDCPEAPAFFNSVPLVFVIESDHGSATTSTAPSEPGTSAEVHQVGYCASWEQILELSRALEGELYSVELGAAMDAGAQQAPPDLAPKLRELKGLWEALPPGAPPSSESANLMMDVVNESNALCPDSSF